MSKQDWQLQYEDFDAEQEALREALCTLGNGYFATRGAAAECEADQVHYPGTYFAGGYNRLDSVINGRIITNEDLVNFPNWLPLTFRIDDDDEWFHPANSKLLNYQQTLDIKTGLLTRSFIVRDQQQRETAVELRRFVSMANRHIAAQHYRVTPQNWQGTIEVRSALDGAVLNQGVARYRELNSKHLRIKSLGAVNGAGIYLHTITTQSHIEVAMAARTVAYMDDQAIPVSRKVIEHAERVENVLRFDIAKQQAIDIEKIVTVYSSRDPAIAESVYEAKQTVKQELRFEELYSKHKTVWKNLWTEADIDIDSKPLADSQHTEVLTQRLHQFHLLQSVSRHTIDYDAGVPARGLHGEAYRGHIFWDELYIMPFYNWHIPQISRALLMYRYRRLDTARKLAHEAGYAGAMYPWQSSSNGEEETQVVHLNPKDQTWGPDYSRYQRHVNIAIFYNIWQYYLTTGDNEFMYNYGLEMMLEIAKFWLSKTTLNEKTGRYEIHNVMGPDEYHEKYPGSKQPGVNNNAYTNLMVVWCFEKCQQVLATLDEPQRDYILANCNVNQETLNKFAAAQQKMFIPFHDDNIISAFDGYEKLQEFDWDGYRKKYGNIGRLDRILKAEDDSPDHYKLSKQADAVMLFYLLPLADVTRLLNQLGYSFDIEAARKTIRYYYDRTSHGSTLSKVVFASVMYELLPEQAREMYTSALISDVEDTQGGTTKEGVHLGVMAGTAEFPLHHYLGLSVEDVINGRLIMHPKLPAEINHVAGNFCFRGQHVNYKLQAGELCLELSKKLASTSDLKVQIADEEYVLSTGNVTTIKLA